MICSSKRCSATPSGEVVRLYDELDDDLSDEARRRMEEWWVESSQDRTGPGNYRPEAFGLDPAVIAEEFAFYHERFFVTGDSSGADPKGTDG